MTVSRLGRCILAIAALAFAVPASAPAARAADAATLTLSLKDHKFEPAELHAPAGKSITLVVKNLGPAPAEFESGELHVEKVITGGGTVTIRLHGLQTGRYRFFDDFHDETEGYLVVP